MATQKCDSGMRVLNEIRPPMSVASKNAWGERETRNSPWASPNNWTCKHSKQMMNPWLRQADLAIELAPQNPPGWFRFRSAEFRHRSLATPNHPPHAPTVLTEQIPVQRVLLVGVPLPHLLPFWTPDFFLDGSDVRVAIMVHIGNNKMHHLCMPAASAKARSRTGCEYILSVLHAEASNLGRSRCQCC